jgi:hypothetical protein
MYCTMAAIWVELSVPEKDGISSGPLLMSFVSELTLWSLQSLSGLPS